jgi:hypothetical protein
VTGNDRISALEQQLQQLTHEMGIMQDAHEVRCLMHKHGYYIDKCLYDEALALLDDNCEFHFLGGIFRGKASVQRLYYGRFRKNFVGDVNGPVYGFLLDHPMMQDVVDVAPDRKTAQVRLRGIIMAGRHESAGGQQLQWWEGCLAENECVKDGGVWKIKVMNYRPVWHADYETGWAHTRPHWVPFFTDTFPQNPTGPDELEDPVPPLWPDTDVFPFHYPHPVTGKYWAK